MLLKWKHYRSFIYVARAARVSRTRDSKTTRAVSALLIRLCGRCYSVSLFSGVVTQPVQPPMSAAQTVLLNAVLLIAYFAAGKFGLSFFALIHPSASAVWLSTGIALAALLLGGLRLVPALFVGAFLVNVTTAGSVMTSLGWPSATRSKECSRRRSSSVSPAAAARHEPRGHPEIHGARGIPHKLPYIEDDGVMVSDSTFIRWHIEQKYRIDFDKGLDASQKAIAWALRMVEDSSTGS